MTAGPHAAAASTDDDAWRLIVKDVLGGIPNRYPVGEQIPTYRGMAARHGVSITPVRTAYGRLKAAGILEAQAGRGVWVARAPRPADEIDGTSVAQQLRDLRTEVATLREQVTEMRGMLPGWPPTE